MDNNPKNKTFRPMILGIGLAAMVLSGCSGPTTGAADQTTGNTAAENSIQQDQTPPAGNAKVGQEESNPAIQGATEESSGETTGEVKTFEVEAGSFYYKPNEIRVKKGDTVRIVLNSVSMMHDFVIDELQVKAPVTQSGKSATIEFTASEAGTFEYYCSVGQHRQNGQVGTLIVEE